MITSCPSVYNSNEGDLLKDSEPIKLGIASDQLRGFLLLGALRERGEEREG